MKHLSILACAVATLTFACSDATKKGDSDVVSMPPANTGNPLFNSSTGGFTNPGSSNITTSIPGSTTYDALSDAEREQLCTDVAAAVDSQIGLETICQLFAISLSQGDPDNCAAALSQCDETMIEFCDEESSACTFTVDQYLSCYETRIDIVSAIDLVECDAMTPEKFEEFTAEFGSAENPPACAEIDRCSATPERG